MVQPQPQSESGLAGAVLIVNHYKFGSSRFLLDEMTRCVFRKKKSDGKQITMNFWFELANSSTLNLVRFPLKLTPTYTPTLLLEAPTLLLEANNQSSGTYQQRLAHSHSSKQEPTDTEFGAENKGYWDRVAYCSQQAQNPSEMRTQTK